MSLDFFVKSLFGVPHAPVQRKRRVSSSLVDCYKKESKRLPKEKKLCAKRCKSEPHPLMAKLNTKSSTASAQSKRRDSLADNDKKGSNSKSKPHPPIAELYTQSSTASVQSKRRVDSPLEDNDKKESNSKSKPHPPIAKLNTKSSTASAQSKRRVVSPLEDNDKKESNSKSKPHPPTTKLNTKSANAMDLKLPTCKMVLRKESTIQELPLNEAKPVLKGKLTDAELRLVSCPTFPASEIHLLLQQGRKSCEVKNEVSLYLAAAEEFVAKELLEAAARNACERGKNKVEDVDILAAIRGHPEYNHLLGKYIS